MTDPENRLRQMLTEDFGPEGEAYLPIVRQLASVPTPPESLGQRAALARLRHQAREQGIRRGQWRRFWGWYPVALLRAEFRVLRWELWIASSFVMLLGVLVTVASLGRENDPANLPLVFAAPVIAAFGVAFVFGPAADPPLEIILALSRSLRLILLARLALVFGFNLLLAGAGSLILAAISPTITLWPLISAWLAPMALLSALAFCVATLTQEPALGGGLSMMIWIWLHTRLPFLPVPAFLNEALWRYLLAVLLCAAGFWLAGKPERWLGNRS